MACVDSKHGNWYLQTSHVTALHDFGPSLFISARQGKWRQGENGCFVHGMLDINHLADMTGAGRYTWERKDKFWIFVARVAADIIVSGNIIVTYDFSIQQETKDESDSHVLSHMNFSPITMSFSCPTGSTRFQKKKCPLSSHYGTIPELFTREMRNHRRVSRRHVWNPPSSHQTSLWMLFPTKIFLFHKDTCNLTCWDIRVPQYEWKLR